MQKEHIAILDPAVNTPEIADFNQMVFDSQLPLTYHLPALQGVGSLGGDTSGLRGVIILGSASSVLEASLWQSVLRNWLEKRLAAKTPILGICYGHQLLAHMLGGAVGYAFEDKRKLSGTRPVNFSANRLSGPTPGKGLLVVSHREIVTSCPTSMKVIAKSEEFPLEALEHESLPVWTVQAHPEATTHFLLHQKMPAVDEAAFTYGRRFVKSFLDYCAKK